MNVKSVEKNENNTAKVVLEVEKDQFQTALDQLHDSAPQYAGALLSVFPEARQIVQQQIENMLNGQATPEEAAAEMASQINSSIEEYNLVNE